MPFLRDKVWEGEYVHLRHVTVADAEAILAAWGNTRVSSTWRHHKPRSLEDERAFLQRLIDNPDRWQYVMIRKASDEIIGCIGLQTYLAEDADDKSPLSGENCRLARMGMLLTREDPWNRLCEIEAIKLLLDATFRQVFTLKSGKRIKICDVRVRVTPTDYSTVGMLLMQGFKIPNINKAEIYHGRPTILMDYMPPDIDLSIP